MPTRDVIWRHYWQVESNSLFFRRLEMMKSYVQLGSSCAHAQGENEWFRVLGARRLLLASIRIFNSLNFIAPQSIYCFIIFRVKLSALPLAVQIDKFLHCQTDWQCRNLSICTAKLTEILWQCRNLSICTATINGINGFFHGSAETCLSALP